MRSDARWTGQTLKVGKEDTQSVTWQSNDTDTGIRGASVGDAEIAAQQADIVKSLENRQFYKIYPWKFSVRYEWNIKCRCKVKRGSDWIVVRPVYLEHSDQANLLLVRLLHWGESTEKRVILPILGVPDFNLLKTDTGGDVLESDRRWRQR